MQPCSTSMHDQSVLRDAQQVTLRAAELEHIQTLVWDIKAKHRLSALAEQSSTNKTYYCETCETWHVS